VQTPSSLNNQADTVQADNLSSPERRALVPEPRLFWLDGIKGLAILWIAYFHGFEAWNNGRFPWILEAHYFSRFMHQTAPTSTAALIVALTRAVFAAFVSLGFHAVGVFVVMSGFGLCYSLAAAGRPRSGWTRWYGSRLGRLIPMYWAAHLLYLISPFQARLEQVDYRFFLSFLGDRVFPLQYQFFYLNAAWWYFGLILELYAIFPLLYLLMRRLGPGWFLLVCAAETVISRYIFIFVLHASGDYTLGAFFGCRLWEFAFGMVIGTLYRKDRGWVDARLFSVGGLIAGTAMYAIGFSCFRDPLAYMVADGLVGTGLFVILAQVAWHSRRAPLLERSLVYVGLYSYGFYLIHQPYMIYFASRLRWMPMWEFALDQIAVVIALAMFAALLEQAVNALTSYAIKVRRAVASDAPPNMHM
jgi:peptidoglycan/LPS O-acetylase OafA/YrhL